MIVALSELSTLTYPDDGLPQNFFVPAEDGIGGTSTRGGDGLFKLLAGEGLDRYFVHINNLSEPVWEASNGEETMFLFMRLP